MLQLRECSSQWGDLAVALYKPDIKEICKMKIMPHILFLKRGLLKNVTIQ